MTDEARDAEIEKKSEEDTSPTGIEPLTDDDLESISGGLQAFCSVVACSG